MNKPSSDNTSSSGQNQTQQNNSSQTQTQNNTPQQTQQTNEKKPTPKLEWVFKEVGEAEFGAPITEVYLVVNGQKNFIIKENMLVSETPAEIYKDYEIPSNALVSCRGWWAGGGNDYWVTQGNGELEVYVRWIEEGSGPDNPAQVGKPELVKKIKM
ncbi:MAG TPA: hypothetical protein VHP32_12395 [Ignavibacteria bacterium]|nr:hypothetical protein [Ignavibacteria bacterium]